MRKSSGTFGTGALHRGNGSVASTDICHEKGKIKVWETATA